METHALIPFVAVLVSATFGGVAIAWDSDRRATRSMGALFLCTGGWALIDLFTYVETDPQRALAWMRWVHVGPLLLGPCALWVVAEMLPQAPRVLRRRAFWSGALALVVGVGSAFVPGSVSAMVATDYGGWMPVYGRLSIILIPLGLVMPIYAAIEAARVKCRIQQDRADQHRIWALRVCTAASILVAMPTEYLLPLMGIPVPRLGAFTVSLSAVLAWLHMLHETDDLSVTPQGLARGVLGKLGDGVALVHVDGTVLSMNARLCEMTGRRSAELLGASLAGLTDIAVETICEGLQDRKAKLRCANADSVPVSLSSSIARNRVGQAVGVVVVFRDVREVDALRTQLLNSGRLAAIGELAAGIAHEVNNPLAFIRSDLNFLAKRMAEIGANFRARPDRDYEALFFDRSEHRINTALEGIERVTQVVGDVREFAHLGGAGQGGSDPETVVRGAMRLARLQRGSEIEMRIASVVGNDLIGSGQELKQVLLALLRVLVESTRKGGRIEADLRTDGRHFTIDLSAGPLIHAASVMLERFEVLTSAARDATHEEFALGVAADLVTRLGGGVRVESEGGDGVRVEVSVPLSGQDPS